VVLRLGGGLLFVFFKLHLRPCFATRECWYLSVFKYQYLFIRKICVSVIFIYQ
jgi:hypothetical protein